MDSDDTDMLAISVLQAAREIYNSYCHSHAEPQRPLGVAIDCQTYRGHLIFTGKPVLLPQECFIPLNQIETLEAE
jgi:hypothetical protein